MKPEELIDRCYSVGYIQDGSDLSGFDCFGFVEFWYKQILNIDVQDRKQLTSNPSGFNQGFAAKKNWIKSQEKSDNSVVVMKSRWGSKTIREGHCGVYYNGYVLHFESDYGFKCDKLNNRINKRITGWFRHK